LVSIFAGRGYKLAFETPKSESLALFRLGERLYDHVLFFPVKTKGRIFSLVVQSMNNSIDKTLQVSAPT